MAFISEDVVELGFEGIDRFAEKYHDKVYQHLPSWKKKQKEQQKNQQSHDSQTASGDHYNHRKDSVVDRTQHDENDIPMSSYTPPHSPSHSHAYAPDGRYEYREERDERYVQDEGWYYKGLNPDPGAPAPRRQDRARGDQCQIATRAYSPPPGYGEEYGVRREREYVERGREYDGRRPAPMRMRSSSWEPRGSERYGDEGKRKRRHSRAREEKETDCINPSRLAATIVGGIVGGFAGNRAGKGQKYDTAATIGGAILGGIASREIADHMVNKKEERRNKQQEWESKYGDEERDHRRGGRKRIGEGRESRDGRDGSDW